MAPGKNEFDTPTLHGTATPGQLFCRKHSVLSAVPRNLITGCSYITLGIVLSAEAENREPEPLVALWMGGRSMSDECGSHRCHVEGWASRHLSEESQRAQRTVSSHPFLSSAVKGTAASRASAAEWIQESVRLGGDSQSCCQPACSLFWAWFSGGNLNTSPSQEQCKVTANYGKFGHNSCLFLGVSWQQQTHTSANNSLPWAMVSIFYWPTEVLMVQIPWPKRHSVLWHLNETLKSPPWNS